MAFVEGENLSIRALAFSLLLLAFSQASAQAAVYDRPPVTTAEDRAAILQLTVDFRRALIQKDVPGLAGLLLDPGILFASPPSPAAAAARRQRGSPGFTGAEPGGFAAFAAFVASSPAELEEKFYDIKVTQDGHLAWVIFDFEFLAGGKVENYGIESWQVLKTVGDQWKIMSVVWSSHGRPN